MTTSTASTFPREGDNFVLKARLVRHWPWPMNCNCIPGRDGETHAASCPVRGTEERDKA